MKRQLLFLLFAFFSLKGVYGAAAYYGPYSSCEDDTDWIRGSGPPIRSWLRSVVPLLGDSPTDIHNTPAGLVATFTRNYNKEYLKEITSSVLNITWRIYGKGKFDGWFYGPTVDGKFSGDQIAYIYQDLTTVILGKFDENEVLVAGKHVKIKGYRCSNGLMELQFTTPKPDSPTFKYEQMTETFITSDMTLMDPHDHRHVYVSNSTLQNLTNGDGIFAKRNIPAHSLVAIYAGLFINVSTSVYFDNMTIDEREEYHKNLMSYNDTHNLNLPPELTSILKYRATLGHKVNNALKDGKSTEFCFVKHPRFGHCRCIRSIRAIEKGEEIFIDYGYDINEESAPRWYKKLHEDASPDDVYQEYSDDDQFDGGRD